VIHYSTIDTPVSIKIELKNEANEILHVINLPLTDNTALQKAVIQLPNTAKLSAVQKVIVVVDQNATQDFSGNFRIQAINFVHLPSSQNIMPDSRLDFSDVSTLPGNPRAELIASTPAGNSLTQIAPNQGRLSYNIPGANDFSGISLNFDPNGIGQLGDLSGLSRLVIGAESDKVKRMKMEIEDVNGQKAVYYLTDVDVSRRYYEFLTSRAEGSVDLKKIKRINFVVDHDSIGPDGSTGSLTLELGGILYP
jgi:hypothetical protein